MSLSDVQEMLPDNPIVLKGIIGRSVVIRTADNSTHVGVVYVIDPIFKTVVVLSEDKMKVIMYHAIKSLELQLEHPLDERIATFPSATVCETAEDINNKQRLKKWLKHMYLEVEDCEGCLKVGEHLTVVAPYTRDSCISDNTIILDKIIKIIDVMPPNFPDGASSE